MWVKKPNPPTPQLSPLPPFERGEEGRGDLPSPAFERG